jgi:hypothetical protein
MVGRIAGGLHHGRPETDHAAGAAAVVPPAAGVAPVLWRGPASQASGLAARWETSPEGNGGTMATNKRTSKGEVLAAIEQERAAWADLLAVVGEDRMLEPGPVEGWTFKDFVAHLATWDSHALGQLEAAARGAEEPAPPWPAELDEDRHTDAINAWIFEHSSDRLLGDVLQDSRETYARLSAIVDLLPEDALDEVGCFPRAETTSLGTAITDGSFFDHWREEHEPLVRRWLEQRGPRPSAGPEARVEL